MSIDLAVPLALSLSPPTRGAWIEMTSTTSSARRAPSSPPTRGAWIEMMALEQIGDVRVVAPHTGGVD